MTTYTLERITVDTVQRTVMACDGRRLHLTGREFNLLATLLRANGAVVPHGRLKDAVRLRSPARKPRQRDAGDSRALTQLVLRLRGKLPPNDAGRSIIRNLHGVGYWIDRPAPAAKRLRSLYRWRGGALPSVVAP